MKAPRRHLLGGLAAVAATACGPSIGAPAAPAPGAAPAGGTAAAPPASAPPAAAPAQVMVISTPAPREAALKKLGVSGIVQPFWSADGSRVLYYDQPAPGQGGTWSVDPASGRATLERPDWGYYVSQGTLVAAARPTQRDTAVLHLPSGRSWTLPTTVPTLFSPDGTVVAYTANGGTMVAGADGQYLRRLQVPINGASVQGWLTGADGAPNGRLLFTGRRRPGDDPALWTYDLHSGQSTSFGPAKRITGLMPSLDGSWIAHVAMWSREPGANGLWLTRADGLTRHRLDLVGSYRWTADRPGGPRLLVIPHRASAAGGHEVWEVTAATGAVRRLLGPEVVPFRVANSDWDVTPDGSQIVFVSADDRSLWQLTLPSVANEAAQTPAVPVPAPPGSGGKPYTLPFDAPPSPSTWYVMQWYGVTTGGYRWRNTTYVQGQGIHFGIDFATAYGSPVRAISEGKIIAVDGDYGSPPHNVVIQLPDGNIAMYGHLMERSRDVEVGQTVQPGQVVGRSGDSLPPYDGTRNPHLHLEIRRGGRAIATNPVAYFDANWDDMTLGVYPGALFERNLDDPRRNQFLDQQPDIWFGGPIISNFARPWPV